MRTDPVDETKLLILFDAGELFILFSLLHLESENCANAILDGCKLSITDGWLYLECPGYGSFPHGEGWDTADECGRWPEGALHEVGEVLRAASVGVPEFLTMTPVLSDFKKIWFSVQSSSGYVSAACGAR